MQDPKTKKYICHCRDIDDPIYFGWDCIQPIEQKFTITINDKSYVLTEKYCKELWAFLTDKETSA